MRGHGGRGREGPKGGRFRIDGRGACPLSLPLSCLQACVRLWQLSHHHHVLRVPRSTQAAWHLQLRPHPLQ